MNIIYIYNQHMTNGYKEVCLNMVDLPITKDIALFSTRQKSCCNSTSHPYVCWSVIGYWPFGKNSSVSLAPFTLW